MTQTYFLHDGSETPVIIDATDSVAYCLGTLFSFNTAGTITQLHWYFPQGSSGGSVTGGIFVDPTGSQASSIETFVSPTLGTWNTVNLATPASVTAGATLQAVIRTPDHYVATSHLHDASVTRGAIGVNPGAGKLGDGSTLVMPTTVYNNNGYFTDVTFVPAGGGAPAMKLWSGSTEVAVTATLWNGTSEVALSLSSIT